ncbi:MAG: hypothetical protein OEM94_10815 [Acidimicrobiia bacterium]|nr:hypothetical protein [Acidimicrobiia bacterium]
MAELFVSDDGGAVHIYERYEDSAAAMVHLGGFGEKFADRFFASVDPAGFDVYGNSDETVREARGEMDANFMTTFGSFAR